MAGGLNLYGFANPGAHAPPLYHLQTRAHIPSHAAPPRPPAPPAPPAPPTDTTPDADRVRLALYRAMAPAEKVRRVADLTRLAHEAALAGLRTRHPDADRHELLLRLAVLRLGADTVARVYGWRAGVA